MIALELREYLRLESDINARYFGIRFVVHGGCSTVTVVPLPIFGE
jgi:hypothetical protein